MSSTPVLIVYLLIKYNLTKMFPITINLEIFESLVAFSLLPLILTFLWCLIAVDVKNFYHSRKAYSIYSAIDPINCHEKHQATELK